MSTTEEKTLTGVELITAERERQINGEGYSPTHDDDHTDGSIALAAAVYALPPEHRPGPARGRPNQPGLWPWEEGSFRPTPFDRIRELVKAGALIAAELDRLQRIEPPDVQLIPVKTDECNFAFHLPEGGDGDGMACIRDLENDLTTSFWLAESDVPDAGRGDEKLALHIVTYGFQPDVEVGFGPTVEEANLRLQETEPYRGWQGHSGFWCAVEITEEVRDYLNGGGRFVLRVGLCPPPVVSVWIA